MDPRPDDGAIAAPDAHPPDARALRKTALWVLVVQCLLALSWTLYVLFLPGMLSAAGIAARWFIYVLIADQIIFAVCDWWAGVYADRIAVVWKRLGRVMIATTMLSSAALLAMPWIAKSGSTVLLLGVIFVWAATSSALRAPVFSLLGRVREVGRESDSVHRARSSRAGMVSIALVGISLAGAVGPYLTILLKAVDDRLPLAVSAIALALAGLWVTRAEALLPRQRDVAEIIDSEPPVSGLFTTRMTRRRAWWLAAIALVAAFGTQLLNAIVAPPLYRSFVGADAVVWAAWFWVGFGLGLVPGARVAASRHALIGAAIAMAIALFAFAIGTGSASFAVLVIGTALAGGGWGVFSTVVFSSAVSLSGGRASARGAGTASGMVFSALAIATFLRMICTASGFAKTQTIVWLPEVAWALASVLLIVVARTVWSDRPEPAPQPV